MTQANHRERLAAWIETMPVRKFIIGVIMFLGWIQGRHILDMFTIGVRWELQPRFTALLSCDKLLV